MAASHGPRAGGWGGIPGRESQWKHLYERLVDQHVLVRLYARLTVAQLFWTNIPRYDVGFAVTDQDSLDEGEVPRDVATTIRTFALERHERENKLRKVVLWGGRAVLRTWVVRGVECLPFRASPEDFRSRIRTREAIKT